MIGLTKWLSIAATVVCNAAVVPAGAASYKSLYAVTGTGDGAGPTGGFIDVGGTLYGNTTYGGASGNGTIIALDPATGTVTKVFDFAGGADGYFPQGSLLNVGGLLYGVTQYGGAHNQGTVFSFNPATGVETIIWSFSGTEGVIPTCSLISVAGNLYGTTEYGGLYGKGTVFKVVPPTGTVTSIHSFGASGDALNPTTGLVQSGGTLYGTSSAGGMNGLGTIYGINPATGVESVVYNFGSALDASTPFAPLTAANGLLYGTSAFGGTSGLGTVFAFNPATAMESVLHSFSGATDGEFPEAGLAYATGTNGMLYGATVASGPSGGGTLFSLSVSTNTLVVKHAFGVADGSTTLAAPFLLKAVLYGMTGYGGANGQGVAYSLPLASGAEAVLHSFTGSTPIEGLGLTVFSSSIYALASNGGTAGVGAVAVISPSTGRVKVLHDFTTASGFVPSGSLTADKELFGVSIYGGNAGCGGLGCGTVFKIDPQTGAQTQITPFPAESGPVCTVADLLKVGGVFYGTTCSGGTKGFGTVFKIDPTTGLETTIYSFNGGSDGAYPFASLLNVKGVLYGTTIGGGAHSVGTIFKFNLSTSVETVLYAFSGAAESPGDGDGSTPYSGLIDTGGVLYGTTFWGGAYGWGSVYSYNISTHKLQILHSFDIGVADGTQPGGNLIYLNGFLYGSTVFGGSNGTGCDFNACGTVFSIDPTNGSETILHSFSGGPDGGNPPYAPLVVMNGVLYGSTGSAGSHGLGTVFSLTP